MDFTGNKSHSVKMNMQNQKKKLADVRKALSSQQMTVRQTVATRGGDNTEVYPWIDNPGG